MFNKQEAFKWNWSWSILRCKSRTTLKALKQLELSSELVINYKLKLDNFWSDIKNPTPSKAVSIFDFSTVITTFPRHSLFFLPQAQSFSVF